MKENTLCIKILYYIDLKHVTYTYVGVYMERERENEVFSNLPCRD
jgi:hypothetical protein